MTPGDGFIKTNCVLRVESLTHGADDVGASTETYATVTGATAVAAFLTVQTVAREDRFGGREMMPVSGILAGTDDALGRQDTRLYVVSVTDALHSKLAGKYLRVESAAPQGGAGLLLEKRYRVRWSLLQTGSAAA